MNAFARYCLKLSLVAGFWLLGETAQAQGGGWERERVAIFYADSRQASCASPQDMVYLTQLLEEQFLRLLPKNRYVLIQGADLITLMQSFSQKAGDQTSCNDQSCAQIARKAQAKIFLEQRFDCARRQVSLTLKRLNQGAVELVEQARLSLEDVGQLASAAGEEKLHQATRSLVAGLGVQIAEKKAQRGALETSTVEVVQASGTVQQGRRGILLVDCNAPQARVFLDRRGQGQVGPDGIFQQAVPSGRYRLRVGHPLYAAVEQDVVVPAGPIQLRVTLEPNFGSLKVVTVPQTGAKIRLNRQSVGESPKIIQRLPAGTVVVRVDHPLFKTVRRRITIRPQTRTELRIEMERKMGDVAIMTRPPGAEVRFESRSQPKDSYQATTPFVGLRPTGSYRVTVSKMGYGTQVHQVKVEEGREVTQEWTLDKAHLVRIETPGVKGVRVQLGREPPQESPAQFSVVAGTYSLKVVDPRYARRKDRITVPVGGLSEAVQFKVQNRPQVSFSGRPAGALAGIGGLTCRTPCTLSPPVGRHRFFVRKKSYLTAESSGGYFEAGRRYKQNYQLQDDSPMGRRGVEMRRRRNEVDGLSQWTVLLPVFQVGNSLPGPGASSRGAMPRSFGLSYRRRWRPWLSTKAWISSGLGGLVSPGMVGKEGGVELLLNGHDGLLSMAQLGVAYHRYEAQGQGLSARLRYLLSKGLHLSPSLRLPFSDQQSFSLDLQGLTYGLNGRWRLTDRFTLEGAAWLPSVAGDSLFQSYHAGLEWRWLGFDLDGDPDREFEHAEREGWLAPSAYFVPPSIEFMSTSLGTIGRITNGAFGLDGMHWISKRFGLGGSVRLASLGWGHEKTSAGFGANAAVFLRPSDEGILSTSELRLSLDGEIFIELLLKGEIKGELMFSLGDGLRIGPVVRQIWAGVDSTSSDDEGSDHLGPESDHGIESGNTSLGYQFGTTAAGLKAEMAFGDDPVWRLLGWYQQGIPGLDEIGFVAVGAGIEFLMVAD
ncbi:MAG: hypothetical protein CMH58_07045 [Myxococcales bacterium]|nr:hypothetical protein [Myxococcales bacterium]